MPVLTSGIRSRNVILGVAFDITALLLSSVPSCSNTPFTLSFCIRISLTGCKIFYLGINLSQIPWYIPYCQLRVSNCLLRLCTLRQILTKLPCLGNCNYQYFYITKKFHSKTCLYMNSCTIRSTCMYFMQHEIKEPMNWEKKFTYMYLNLYARIFYTIY